MIIKKIWINRKSKDRHDQKHLEMHGWFLLGVIPLYIVEYRTLG